MDKQEIKNLITQVIRQNDMRNRQGKNPQDVLMGILQYISDSEGGEGSDINLIPGGGIEITPTQKGIQISIDKTALESIQYADTEVRRLEKDKVPYAYDAKLKKNINIQALEGGGFIVQYQDDNYVLAKLGVYEEGSVIQNEIANSHYPTVINTSDKVYMESPSGKSEMALVSQITDEVFQAYKSKGGIKDKDHFFQELTTLIDGDGGSVE